MLVRFRTKNHRYFVSRSSQQLGIEQGIKVLFSGISPSTPSEVNDPTPA